MLKNRKAKGKPALETVSIFLARSINNFLISSVLLPPPHAAPGGFKPVFAAAPGVFRTVTALLELAFESLLLLGVEVTAAVEVSLLSCTSPSCYRDKEGRGCHRSHRRDRRLFCTSLIACSSDRPLSKAWNKDLISFVWAFHNCTYLKTLRGMQCRAYVVTETVSEALPAWQDETLKIKDV